MKLWISVDTSRGTMTGQVNVSSGGWITECPAIWRRFKLGPVGQLVKWLRSLDKTNSFLERELY